jgi:flagellar protein FliS
VGYNQAYNAYKNTNIKTASQGKLIVLLYDEAVKQLTLASSLFNSEDKLATASIEKVGAAIIKTQDIITELQVSLDMEKGGQIASNLMSLYVYFNSELTNANINKDKKKIDFVLQMMKELASSWKVAAESSANTAAPEVRPALNIEG